MPAKIVSSEFIADVDNEAPLPHVNNPYSGQQFLPTWARIVIRDGEINTWVRGPLLGKDGKLMKRLGYAAYDVPDSAREMPSWLQDLVRTVTNDTLKDGQ